MKKILITPLFVLFVFAANAEWDMLFCTNADSINTCKLSGEQFKRTSSENPLQVMVMSKEALGVDKLLYMIFLMKNEKEGNLYADLTLTINPEALFAVKRIKFYKPGTYKIDILDAATNKPLTTGKVTITE